MIASILCYLYLPESVRWLMIQGRIIEAHHIIQTIAKTSNFILLPFKLISPVPVPHSPEPVIYRRGADLTLPNDVPSDVTAEEPSYMDLIKVPYLRRISLPLWYVWFIFGYTYYGIILYINRIYTTTSYTAIKPTYTNTVTSNNTPTYTSYTTSHSNSTFTTTPYTSYSNTDTADTMNTCQFDYISILLNASAELLGIYICCHIIDKIGRIHTQTIFFILCAIGVIIMSLPSLSHNNQNYDQNSDLNSHKINRFLVIFFSYITRLCIMCATSAIWVSTPELYPTYIRATG